MAGSSILFSNKYFKVGFGLGTFLFIIANVISFISSSIEYEGLKRFSGVIPMRWGYPFVWRRSEGFESGTVFNGFVFFGLAFGLGLLFWYINQRKRVD